MSDAEKASVQNDDSDDGTDRIGSKQERARAELREISSELAALQAQMAEWSELNHLLHEVSVAFSLFYTWISPSGAGCFDAGDYQALLGNWRPCQERLDVLADFAEGIEHIGEPFGRKGRELHGARWAAEIVALQFLFEDALKENSLSPEGLIELAEEFNRVCRRCLTMADCGLRTGMDRLQRLSTRLQGEIL